MPLAGHHYGLGGPAQRTHKHSTTTRLDPFTCSPPPPPWFCAWWWWWWCVASLHPGSSQCLLHAASPQPGSLHAASPASAAAPAAPAVPAASVPLRCSASFEYMPVLRTAARSMSQRWQRTTDAAAAAAAAAHRTKQREGGERMQACCGNPKQGDAAVLVIQQGSLCVRASQGRAGKDVDSGTHISTRRSWYQHAAPPHPAACLR